MPKLCVYVEARIACYHGEVRICACAKYLQLRPLHRASQAQGVVDMFHCPVDTFLCRIHRIDNTRSSKNPVKSANHVESF